jgi:hypothetical protein
MYQFENGVTLRAQYRQLTAVRVAVEVVVTAGDGTWLHTLRRGFSGMDGGSAIEMALDDLRERLAACSINQFKGKWGMAVVKSIMIALGKRYHRESAVIVPVAV